MLTHPWLGLIIKQIYLALHTRDETRRASEVVQQYAGIYYEPAESHS